MKITNESHTDYHKKIGSYLQQCAPDQRVMNIPKMIKLQSLSIRDLAWMIAILEKPYQYVAIPWGDPLLRERVDVLHNCFLTKIERDAARHADKDEFKFLTYDAKLTVIYQFMGVTWEMTHDYKGKAIATYIMNFDTEQDSFNTTLIGVITASGAKKADTEENYIPIGLPATSSSISAEQIKIWEEMQLPMMPWNIQHNKAVRADQIMQLLRDICIENPLRIDLDKLIKLETINSYNLAFVIAICLKEEQTRLKVKFSDLAIWSEVLSIHNEMWNILDMKLHRPENKFKYTDDVDMRRDQTFKLLSVSLLPDQARLWLEEKHINATTNKQEQQAIRVEQTDNCVGKKNKNTAKPTASKPKFREDSLSTLMIEHIFPQLSVSLTTHFNPAFALECWNALPGENTKIIVKIHSKKGEKDARQFQAVTAENENIFCTFKSFRTRLPNLLNCYKETIQPS